MKKICNAFVLFLATVLILTCFCLCTACDRPMDYRGLNFGRYYLEGSEEVYIEIKDDHKAILNNLDFSDLDPEKFWGQDENWVEGYITREEVIAAMQGEKEYCFFDNGHLCFEVKAKEIKMSFDIVFQISFQYNGFNELKTIYNNDVYILNK